MILREASREQGGELLALFLMSEEVEQGSEGQLGTGQVGGGEASLKRHLLDNGHDC